MLPRPNIQLVHLQHHLSVIRHTLSIILYLGVSRPIAAVVFFVVLAVQTVRVVINLFFGSIGFD